MKRLLLCFMLLPFILGAQTVPIGWVDQSFGLHGSDTIADATVTLLTVFSGDSLIAVGNDIYDGLIVSKFDNEGHPCPSFGVNGSIHFHIPGYSDASGQSVVVHPDSRILIARMGADGNGNPATSTFYDFLIVRIMPDGSFDTSFNHTGILAADIDRQENYLTSIALQPDGKILASGTTETDSNQRLELVRFNSNGSIDSGFGMAGRAEVTMGNNGNAMYLTLQDDGSIIVGGNVNINGTINTVLMRFNSVGKLDSMFGINGQNIAPAVYFGIYSLHALPSGKFLASGGTEIVRYTVDGIIDSSFATNGIAQPNTNQSFSAVCHIALAPHGKIAYTLTEELSGGFNEILARFNSDGSLDTTFGNAGIIQSFSPKVKTYHNYMRAVQVQSSGKIVASGYVQTGVGDGFGFLTRYFPTATGTPAIAETLNHFTLYPNPTRHAVTITSQVAQGNVSLQILSLSGKLVTTQNVQFENGKGELRTDLVPGIYQLQLLDTKSGEFQTGKLVIAQ